ncbi:hypothetical protein ROZALSC1DRAFT_29374, partial [Rozella allomycis CSF55]
ASFGDIQRREQQTMRTRSRFAMVNKKRYFLIAPFWKTKLPLPAGGWISKIFANLKSFFTKEDKVSGYVEIDPEYVVLNGAVYPEFPLGSYRGDQGKLVIVGHGVSVVQEVDPMTLEAKKVYDIPSLVPNTKGNVMSSTCVFDKYQIIMDFSDVKSKELCKYRIIKMTREISESRYGGKLVASFLARPSFLYTFSVTSNYIIIPLIPYVYKNAPFESNYSMGNKTLSEILEYQGDQDLLFYVIDKNEGKSQYDSLDPINNSLVVDCNTYEDDSILDYLKIKNLRDPATMGALPFSATRRFILSDISIECAKYLSCGGLLSSFPTMHFQFISSDPMELGCINPFKQGLKHRYVYGLSLHKEDRGKVGLIWNAIRKIDLEGEDEKSPIFIAKEFEHSPFTASKTEVMFQPQGVTSTGVPHEIEDEGVIVSIVYNSHIKSSFVLLLDARNLTEITRYYLPCIVPLSFSRGSFVSHPYPSIV